MAREDIKDALEHLKDLAPGPADDTPAKQLEAIRRAMLRYGDAAARPPLVGIEFVPIAADDVPCEWIIPEGGSRTDRIVHLHGGSLVAGSPASHRAMLSLLARHTQRPVLCVDYRLAPEHTYPAAHDDCLKAFSWAARHGPYSATPARSLALSGDSSGAALAATTCAQAILNGVRPPDCLVLFGALLLAHQVAARPDRHSDPLISNAALAPLQLYAPDASMDLPQLSPLHTADDVLRLFPPTLLQVSASEFLLYDSIRMAERLAGLNRRAVLSIWPDLPHLWHHFTTLLPEADLALSEAARFIGHAFAASPPSGSPVAASR